MADRYDVVSTTVGKDGKKRYHKIGAMFASRQGDGYTIKLDSLPLPNKEGDVWLSCFVPRPKEDRVPVDNSIDDAVVF